MLGNGGEGGIKILPRLQIFLTGLPRAEHFPTRFLLTSQNQRQELSGAPHASGPGQEGGFDLGALSLRAGGPQAVVSATPATGPQVAVPRARSIHQGRDSSDADGNVRKCCLDAIKCSKVGQYCLE